MLLFNNFGRRKNDPSKDRKALETYVSLRGYKNGELGNGRKKGCQDGIAKLTLDEIAKELNMSKRNLQRALRIERNLTDSMKELHDTSNRKNQVKMNFVIALCYFERIEFKIKRKSFYLDKFHD